MKRLLLCLPSVILGSVSYAAIDIYQSQGSLLYITPLNGMQFNADFAYRTHGYTQTAATGGSFSSFDEYEYEGALASSNVSYRYSFYQDLVVGIDANYTYMNTKKQIDGKNSLGNTLSAARDFNALEVSDFGYEEPALYVGYRLVNSKEYSIAIDLYTKAQFSFESASRSNNYIQNSRYAAVDGNNNLIATNYSLGAKAAQRFGSFEWSSDFLFSYFMKGTYIRQKADLDVDGHIYDTAVLRLANYSLSLDSKIQYQLLQDFTVGGLINLKLLPANEEVYFRRDSTATYNKKYIDSYSAPFVAEIGTFSRYLITDMIMLDAELLYAIKSSGTLKQTWTDLEGNNPQIQNYDLANNGEICAKLALGVQF